MVKFTIANMLAGPEIRWLDSGFYSLHDEWYWYRLLNGAAVPGTADLPKQGLRFNSVAEIYSWAQSLSPTALPYDLQWVGSQSVGTRLYSDHFYDLALNVDPRVYGLGSVVHFPTSPGDGERWVIELEFQDDAPPSQIALFFELLAPSLPGEIGDSLEWVIRSPEQEQVAREMAAASLPFHDRVVRFSELVEPGQVAVYNEGIAAGRLLLIGDGGKELSDARDNDILLVENVPDWLPPARALISSSPQTPLAHVNLLARNRGIPNVSQSGILGDAGIRQAARVRAPAIVRATAPGGLEVVLITEQQYSLWQARNLVEPISAPNVDIVGLPNVIDLSSIAPPATDAEVAQYRAVIGGKAAGFFNLLAASPERLPPDPLAITVKPYREHAALVEAELDAMLRNTSFGSSARTRYLMLEGADAFLSFYTADADREFAESFAASNPAGTPVGDILRAGGFGSYFRDVPLDPGNLRVITAALEATYGSYALSQGLRFRSSSTVEDIEGFNGAGLYDSNTGFLRPDVQLDGGDQKKSIEWALKKTWASYWGFEAFEERRREKVDHRSGAMAVLVHATFSDSLEQANAVFTFTVLPSSADDALIMTINAQDGAVSVANPDPALGALPEVAILRRASLDAPIRIVRTAESNQIPSGEDVLTDAQLRTIFEEAQAVAVLWQEQINASLPAAQRIETLTLDFELKEMAAGWPMYLGQFPKRPASLVIKQARTLEPGLRGIPDDVVALAIPRDVLSRSRLVERISCASDGVRSVAVHVLTDPLLGPDVGFAESPFVVSETGAMPGDLSECDRQILYSTPDQYLIELLERGELLNLSL